MEENTDLRFLQSKRKSKKITKSVSLLDFVVVKRKIKKTSRLVKVSSQINRKIGKVRKKKLTTIKKRILKERMSKLSIMPRIPEDDESVEAEELLNERMAEISLRQTADDPFTSGTDAVTPNDLSAPKDNSVETTTISESPVLHSRNFREYCNHFISPEIKQLTELVLKDLFKFQENKFLQNPVKAKANKRYVVGFKEVKKFLVVKRLKLIVIAPDLERNSEIETLIGDIKSLADHNSIPYVFSIKRRHIGYLLLKKVPVSLVGIFDYQGSNENVTNLLKLVQQERLNYRNKKAGIT